MKSLTALALAALLPACAGPSIPTQRDAQPAPPASTPADAFFAALHGLCGKAYAGKLAAFNETDTKAFAGAAVMHVRDCTADEVRIPFHVGENRSRTWIITRTREGLRLKHDHRHADGSPDALTMYGGDSVGASDGTAQRQHFPADAASKAMFQAGGMAVSIDNVWAIELLPGQRFSYELRRPGRHFQVDFDLAAAVPIPPPAWGSESR